MRWCLAVITVVFLASCGGGNGDNAINTMDSASTNSIPANTVVTANSTLPGNAFTATLTGAQEVPPVASDATAAAAVMVDPATRLMKATIVTAGIAGTAAHIHEGAPGVAGPIIFPLTETSAGSGIWTTQATLTDEQLNKLMAGNYYVNVHSAAFPNGEIRGQLVHSAGTGTTETTVTTTTTATGIAMHTTFINVLTGTQEVPPNASTAIGIGVIIVDPVAKKLAISTATMGITGTAAHIHEGALGVSGPIVFPLTETPLGSGIWITETSLTDQQLNTLRAGNYYVNVHSAAFPNGEIRAQIGQNAVIGTTGTAGAAGTGTAGTGTY